MELTDLFDNKFPVKISQSANNGAPKFIPTNGLNLSLSHSQNFIASAFSKKSIGVDIQSRAKIRPDFISRIYKNILSNKLQREISDPIALWSCLESAAKCSGLGTSYLLTNSTASKNKQGWTFTIRENSIISSFSSFVINSDFQHVLSAAIS
ncbi:4'-phosphopantetheinyl transferase family protein [Aurantimicrobium minutum]|uniref:4'-phosphopantetheinyl transferase family protein n=1 Tax=Aurantimicrobium minutum TaxID=708131 RepID=UPI002407383F|nr:hypothetical protein [Aurantimicrobium minutum]